MKISPFNHGSELHTKIMKTDALKNILDLKKFDAVFVIRRDEEKSRAKERIFLFVINFIDGIQKINDLNFGIFTMGRFEMVKVFVFSRFPIGRNLIFGNISI